MLRVDRIGLCLLWIVCGCKGKEREKME